MNETIIVRNFKGSTEVNLNKILEVAECNPKKRNFNVSHLLKNKRKERMRRCKHG